MQLNSYFVVDPLDAYVHTERYVNNGSPSGFTELHATSDETSPFGNIERFPLLCFSDEDVVYEEYGEPNMLLNAGQNYAHPDSLHSMILGDAGRLLRPADFLVSPVSGGRTFIVRGKPAGYLKLTYDIARIGRVDRQLTREHCVGSLEVSSAISAAIEAGLLGNQTAIMREPSARVSLLSGRQEKPYEWGSIFREAAPYPFLQSAIALIPGFALFSTDRKSPHDLPLIVQIIRANGSDPESYVEALLKMIITSYWKVVLNCALHIEAHGQNCFVEFDSDWNPLRFVIKDMDSVDKDLPLAAHLGLEREWISYPYMCFDQDIWYYNIRASFMYDFKLGKYLLDPILQSVALAFDIDIAQVSANLREYVQSTFLGLLPENYFPADGRWYFADNTERMPGTRRTYHSKPDPQFR